MISVNRPLTLFWYWTILGGLLEGEDDENWTDGDEDDDDADKSSDEADVDSDDDGGFGEENVEFSDGEKLMFNRHKYKNFLEALFRVFAPKLQHINKHTESVEPVLSDTFKTCCKKCCKRYEVF